MADVETAEPIAALEADALIFEARARTGLEDFDADLSFMTGYLQPGVPAFADWLQTTVAGGQYRTHRRMLQQFQKKGSRGRWTFKSPQYLFDLPGLVKDIAAAIEACRTRDVELGALAAATATYLEK